MIVWLQTVAELTASRPTSLRGLYMGRTSADGVQQGSGYK